MIPPASAGLTSDLEPTEQEPATGTLAMRAIVAGTLATLMTGAVVGLLAFVL